MRQLIQNGSRQRKHRSMRMIPSFLLALAVVGVGAYYGSDLVEALYTLDLRWGVYGLACYAVNYGLRAVRFRILSQARINLWPEGLHAACLHGFATYLMPFRSGELTLPVLLRSLTGLTLTEGSRLLIKARFLDIQTLGAWIIFAALIADIQLPRTMRSVWFSMGAIMIITPQIIRWLGARGRRSGFKLFDWFGRLTEPNPMRNSEFIVSAGIWAAVAGCYFCAARAIGIPLSLMQVWLLISIQLPMQLIPVQGIANAGNHEGGWVAGLMLLGVSAEAALEFALLSHAVILVYVLALGPATLLTGFFCRSNSSS